MTPERDEHDLEAERWLPCICFHLPTVNSWQLELRHKPHCPASNRFSLAAVLREGAQREAELQREVEKLRHDNATEYVRGREDEQRARDTVHVPHIAALKVQLADAKKQGMERAVEIAEGYFNAYDAQIAIRAEIEKELPLPGIACRCQFCGKSECECCDADVDPDIGDK